MARHTLVRQPLARVQPVVGRKPDTEAYERDSRRDAGDDSQAFVVAAIPPHCTTFTAGREDDGRR